MLQKLIRALIRIGMVVQLDFATFYNHLILKCYQIFQAFTVFICLIFVHNDTTLHILESESLAANQNWQVIVMPKKFHSF